MRAALVLIAVLSASEARAEDWANAFEIGASSDADTVVITVRPTRDGHYVNADYPTKLTLASTGTTLSKTTLRRDDARFVDAGLPGKAKRATFSVGAKGDGTITVTYKLTVCTSKACSPPLKGTFTHRHRGPRAPRPPPAVRAPVVEVQVGLRAERCGHRRWPGAPRVAP
ncbi:MAG: hypothetical protein RKU31_43165 [Deltaproteobacteria bacterium]|jgi:hypothetical protein